MSCCKNTAKPEQMIALLKAEQGTYTLLGLCQKAGRLISGGDAVQKALVAGQVRVLLLAEDLSENSLKKLRLAMSQVNRRAAERLQIWRFGTKESLALAAGKPVRGIWAVCDDNFADGMAKKLALLAENGKAIRLDLKLTEKQN